MSEQQNYANISFQEDGRLKLLIIVGTRPEVIRLSATIQKCRQYFDCILAHTGQNYDYNLNGIFFRDLKLEEPEIYLDAAGADLGETMGNILRFSYQLMQQIRPDALLILGDTNSCLSAISAKRLHIPIFHMEAGNRCKDECLPEETNRRIVDIITRRESLLFRACPALSGGKRSAEGTDVCDGLSHGGSVGAEPGRKSNTAIFTRVWVWKKADICCFPPIGRKTSIPRRILSPFSLPSTVWRKSTTCRFCIPAIREAGSGWRRVDLCWTGG